MGLEFVVVQITGKTGGSGDLETQNQAQGAPWVISQIEQFAESCLIDQPQQKPLELVDIAHSESFGRMNIVLVVSFHPPMTPAGLSMGLRTALAATGLQVDVEALDKAQIQMRLEQHEQPVYVLSIIAHDYSFELFSRLNRIFERFALSVHTTRRLTGSAPMRLAPAPVLLAQDQSKAIDSQNKTYSVLEYRITGACSAVDEVRSALQSLSQYLHVDLALQRDNALRRAKRLVVFDMDSTLIQAEVIDELAKCAGVGAQVSAITERAMQGEIDFTQSFCERLALLKGLPESTLVDIAQNLPFMQGLEPLVATLHAQGIKTAIVSGGFTYFARHLQQKLGFDFIFANELEIGEEGLVTGRPVLPIVDAQRKADIVKQLAQELGFDLEQVVAVGDGANDLLMLKAVGMGIAFRAKPLVRQSAKLALTTAGLEGVLYLMGMDSRDVVS